MIFKTSTINDGNMSFRIGETDNTLNNRIQFLQKNGVDFKNHVCMKCDHGEKITQIDWNTPSRHFGAMSQEEMLLSEVLVTQEKGLVLMLLTADCLPVSFYDPVTQTIALAHFSRETITNLLPQKTISFLREQISVDASDLLVQIGPHIHTSSYSFPLPQPVMAATIEPFIQRTSADAHINLVAANNRQLIQEGVSIENITTSKIDTAISSEHFSHYRSKKGNTTDGRIATVVLMGT